MSTLHIGFTARAADIGGGSDPDIDDTWPVTLATGVKAVDQTTLVAGNTPTTSTVLWQAAKSDGTTQHGVAGASALFAAMVVGIDPKKSAATALPLGVRALYTSAAGAVLTDVAFQQRDRTMPLVLPASVRDSADAEYFLTRVEARNRNASDALNARVIAWK